MFVNWTVKFSGLEWGKMCPSVTQGAARRLVFSSCYSETLGLSLSWSPQPHCGIFEHSVKMYCYGWLNEKLTDQ